MKTVAKTVASMLVALSPLARIAAPASVFDGKNFSFWTEQNGATYWLRQSLAVALASREQSVYRAR